MDGMFMTKQGGVYHDTPIPGTGSGAVGSAAPQSFADSFAAGDPEGAGAACIPYEIRNGNIPDEIRDTDIPDEIRDTGIPDEIRDMMYLYEYGDGSFVKKCENFYRQGKFMEDYEDDRPWSLTYTRFFVTYHDLTVKLLRGYFSWRTKVRQGCFSPIATSLVYLYLYELLSGIGTVSPEDALRKMEAFESGYLDAGLGEEGIRNNLHRWMSEYAILHAMPPEMVRRYMDPALVEQDEALAALKHWTESTDEQIVEAILAFSPKRLGGSPVLTGTDGTGRHLLAEVWRQACILSSQEGEEWFAACFGRPKTYRWRPLSNAVYWDEAQVTEADYQLNPCRSYECTYGVWRVRRYDRLYFDRDRFHMLIRCADRMLRRHLKTGRYLKENAGEARMAVYAEAAIAAQKREEQEAARAHIHIDFSGLDQIREDAGITRERLLTEEERESSAEVMQKTSAVMPQADSSDVESRWDETQPGNGDGERGDGACPGSGDEEEQSSGAQPGSNDAASGKVPYSRLLEKLLAGEDSSSMTAWLKEQYLMPSVVVDAVNEALFDEIGDTVLDYDGAVITIVEDYREELAQIVDRNKRGDS